MLQYGRNKSLKNSLDKELHYGEKLTKNLEFEQSSWWYCVKQTPYGIKMFVSHLKFSL